jgi:hypothetical protein
MQSKLDSEIRDGMQLRWEGNGERTAFWEIYWETANIACKNGKSETEQ